jgi:hypothetical protein
LLPFAVLALKLLFRIIFVVANQPCKPQQQLLLNIEITVSPSGWFGLGFPEVAGNTS